MVKNELRTTFKQQRLALDAAIHNQLSLQIAQSVLQVINFQDFDAVHCYLPISKFAEINTVLLLNKIKERFPNYPVFVPKISADGQHLHHYVWQSDRATQINKWGIPEPLENDQPQHLPERMVVFVPLLAFDINGHRVGYGKGFYDRFLQTLGSKTLKVGLSFFESVSSISDLNQYDQALDYCITPQQIYRFGNVKKS